MHEKTINQLLALREDLSILGDKHGESILHITNSSDLQNDIQVNVINYITEATEQIDAIIEDIENGEYDEVDESDYDDE
jgi:hypothetical protein